MAPSSPLTWAPKEAVLLLIQTHSSRPRCDAIKTDVNGFRCERGEADPRWIAVRIEEGGSGNAFWFRTRSNKQSVSVSIIKRCELYAVRGFRTTWQACSFSELSSETVYSRVCVSSCLPACMCVCVCVTVWAKALSREMCP